LGQALASVPGVYLTNDRVYEQVGVRGLSIPNDFNVRVLLLLNGQPINDKYYGNFLTELGPDMLDAVERIEVVKGPASALFGSNAVFATVNIVTRKGADMGGHATVSAEGGSGPYGRGVFTYGNAFKNGLDVFVTGHYESNRGQHHIDFGRVGEAHGADDSTLSDAYASAKYKDFSFQAFYGDRDKEMPTDQYGILLGNEYNETHDKWLTSELKWQKEIDTDKQLMMRAYYENSVYNANYVYDATENPDQTTIYERTRDRWVGYEAQFNWEPVKAHRLTLGANYEYHWPKLSGHYKNQYGVVSEVYPGTRDDFPYAALYVQNEYRIIKPLTLTAGVRYDTYPDFDVDRLSPRAALVWSATDETTVKLIYGQSFRAPSVYERTYPEGSATGSASDLESETFDTYEMVLEQQFPDNLFGRISVFHNEAKKLVAAVEESATETVFENVFDATTTGVEAELTKRFKNGVRSFVNGTFQNSFSGNQRLVNSPAWIANFGLVVPIIGDKLAFSVRQNYTSERQARTAGDRSDDAFTTDLALTSDGLLPNWSFSFKVENLLDADTSVPASESGNLTVISQRGRVFVFRATYRF
jgi:iron complex outermembrane receptor protein